MDEMYLRRVVEKRVERGTFVAMIFVIGIAAWLLDHYTPWSTWWVLLLGIPLIPLQGAVKTTLRDAIFKQRGFHESPFRELVGVTDGRIYKRSKFLNRFEWVGMIVASPFFVAVIYMVYGMGMKGDPLVTILVAIGALITLLEAWWLEPFQRMILKRRGWDVLYTEREQVEE